MEEFTFLTSQAQRRHRGLFSFQPGQRKRGERVQGKAHGLRPATAWSPAACPERGHLVPMAKSRPRWYEDVQKELEENLRASLWLPSQESLLFWFPEDKRDNPTKLKVRIKRCLLGEG